LNQNSTANSDFFQNLGKLFYAIAAADKCVKEEEFIALKTIVNNEWLLMKDEQNNLSNKGAKSIIDTFKWLQNDDEYNAKVCFNSFINFKRAHESLFNKTINSKILKTAGAIAASFSSQNKSELILLAKLNLELKKGNP